jgi:nicotinamidase-related amidase
MAAARQKQALLILDMISEFEFPDWEPVLRAARRIAPAIARLRERARVSGIPVVYVNDMRGDWETDQSAFLERCGADRARGKSVTEALCPEPDDYFLFKPKHSGFYSTSLAEFLQVKSIEELILTGTTSHQCVLFTAMDAYVRDYRIVVPVDCIGAPTPVQTRHALFILKESLRARTPRSSSIRLGSGSTRAASRRAARAKST